MKSNHRKKNSTLSPAAASYGQNTGLRSEWPLLVFPIALLAALAVLSVIDRSIKRDITAGPAHRHDIRDEKSVAANAGPFDRTAPAARKDVPPLPGSGSDSDALRKTPGTAEHPATSRERERPDTARRVPPFPQQTDRHAIPEGLEGPGLIIAILRDAARENDQAAIKKCLDELVALGDQVIAPLTRLMSGETGDAGLWAAEALVRIGTPLATSALLDTLSQIKEGLYKEQLGKRIAAITNHESWPILLDNVLHTQDATVLRAAATSLSRMADKPIIDEMIARYDAAAGETDAERIAKIISNIQSPKATDSLISLAGDVASAPQDMLERAAIEALGKVGDPQAVSYLMRKLEASPPGEGDYLFNAISQIRQPQAQDALLYAASGSKEVSAESGRTAAIYALANYPDARTCALLEQIIATEDNERVATAAARTLDDIHRTSPHVVANAQSLIKKEFYGPVKE